MKALERSNPIERSRRDGPRPRTVVVVPDAGTTGPGPFRIFKRLVFTGVIGAGIAVAGFQLTQTPSSIQEYQTEEVKRHSIVQQVLASGPLAPSLKAEVQTLVSGTAVAVYADFGAQVDEGQPLAQLDPATAQLTLKEAEVNLGSARATVDVAQSRLAASKTLMKEGLLPKSEYDKSVSDLKQAQGNARIAESNVSRAKIELERCTLRSPLKGVVIARNVNVGQSIETGNTTTPLFVVASDLSKMQIEANVSESDIGGVRPGMKASFTVDAFPDETFEGQVTQVRSVPLVDQTVVTYPVMIETDNGDLRLKPGMTASVTIVVSEHKDVLTVPAKALRFRPSDGKDSDAKVASTKAASAKDPGGKDDADKDKKDKHDNDKDDDVTKAPSASSSDEQQGEKARVYRVARAGTGARAANRGPLEKVTITTGASDGKWTEVLTGLDEGDRVVVALDKKKDDDKGGLFARLPGILSGTADKKKGK